MKIIGIESLSTEEINHELDRGGRFVVFQYTISVIVMTFRRSSDIYFVRGGQSAAVKGLLFTGISLVAGWWGIPWGPIYTIGSIITNSSGGKDVTQDLLAALQAPPVQ